MAYPGRATPEGERRRLDKSGEDMLQRMDKPRRHGAGRANRKGKPTPTQLNIVVETLKGQPGVRG